MPRRIGMAVVAAALLTLPTAAAELDDALAAIKSIQREGVGNEQAAARWKEIVRQGPKALPAVLAAFDGADAVAVNWLRTAAEAIAENEQRAGRPIPTDLFEAFVKNTARPARARELSYELLLQVDPKARQRLLPGRENDPAGGLRREAITLALEQVQAQGEKAPLDSIQSLFTAARDVDQVEAIAKLLKARNAEPNVIAHMGLITRWQVAGPFDNTGLKGFAAPLPEKVQWKDFATGHDRATVDLYQALGKKKGLDPMTKKKDAVYALARTEIESPRDQAVEIRAASQNAVRLYLNGQEVFAREEYHHGESLDQHIGRGTLKQGRNEIVVKVCQDDATMEWTLVWQFQLRVCDALGGAVPLTVKTAPNAVPVKPEPPKKETTR